MLVLSRKPGEEIKIGDNVTITVVAGGKVKLGITAPKDVPVDRGEVAKRKDASTRRVKA